MNVCDLCGHSIAESHPFRICPGCLFAGALESDLGNRPDSSPVVRPAPAKSTLFARPDFFGKYEIQEQIGEGGQGDIWSVWDAHLRRRVAMKRLAERHICSEAVVYRFLAEAQIASQLEHPGILPIFDAGLDPDGRPYYTTQLLPGTTLADVWQKVHASTASEWTQRRALELMLHICDVMAHAHSRGVIHRDLKPGNVLVGKFGDVRVIDWGSAYVLEEQRHQFEESFVTLNCAEIQTDRGQAMWGVALSPLSTAVSGQPVTVIFMPPEVLAGDLKELGPATDIYSLGVMLYELLAGQLPYTGRDGQLPEPSALRELIRSRAPDSIRVVNKSVSRDLSAICGKAMSREKSERYRSMPELAADIRAALETRPVQARRPGPVLKVQRWARRHTGQVLLGGLSVLIVCAAFAVARGLKAQRDVAEQVTALRSAELSARSGQWRDALRHWQEAESAGYKDASYLGLQRAEAWTVLSSPARSRAELDQLFRRADLKERRGAVLLRLGEHELFDQSSYEQGVQHVHEALATDLTGADEKFARGLLADSTPEALELFRQAIEADPYHHGAHRHSLGLEFTLGRHEELQTHFRIFKTLFPDDPSARYLEAAEFAADGQMEKAEGVLQNVRDAASPQARQQLIAGLQTLAATAREFDVDVLLGERRSDNTTPPGLPVQNPAPLSEGTGTLRVPELPCLRRYREGWNAVGSLALGLIADPQPALEAIKTGWHHHPEALLPAFAGKLLENRQPRAGAKSIPLLLKQAELFQMAADSPSIMPGVPRYTRYLAATAQFTLTQIDPTNAAARAACLQNLRRAADSIETSAAEHRAYFDLALELADHDLARELLGKWERQQPQNPEAVHGRIKLELACENITAALRLLDQLLAEKPDDAWALGKRGEAKKKVRTTD